MPPKYNPGVETRQVTTSVTDNFAPIPNAQAPQQSRSGAQDLMRALKGFEATAKTFVDERTKQAEADADVEARKNLAIKGFDAVKKARADGTLYSSDDPIVAAAHENHYGRGAARNLRSDIMRRLQPGHEDSFDFSTVNPDDVVGEYVANATSELGENRYASSGFSEEFGRFEGVLRDSLKRGASAYVTGRSLDQVHENFSAMVSDGLSVGQSASDIHKTIRGAYPGQSGAYGISLEKMDEVVVGVAASLASQPGGNYEVVSELLTGNRDGVGPISGKRSLATKSLAVLETARKAETEKIKADSFEAITDANDLASDGQFTEEAMTAFRTKHPKALSDAALQSLHQRSNRALDAARKEAAKEATKIAIARAHQSSVNGVNQKLTQIGDTGLLATLRQGAPYIKESGKRGEYSVSKLQDMAVEQFLARSTKLGPNGQFERELTWFTKNGLEHPQWKGLLASGHLSANQNTIDPNNVTTVPAQFEIAQDLYEKVHAKSPAFVQHLGVPAQALDFYESVRVFRKYGVDSVDAFRNALVVQASPMESPTQRSSLRDLGDFMKKFRNENNFTFSGKPTRNMGHMSVVLERVAEKYVRLGLAPAEALEEAKGRVLMNYTQINGWMTYTGDTRINPETFPTMVQTHLEQFAKNNKLDIGDLSIANTGNAVAQWKIVLGANAMAPVSRADAPGLIFGLPDLAVSESRRRDQVRADLLALHRDNLANRPVVSKPVNVPPGTLTMGRDRRGRIPRNLPVPEDR